VLFDIYKQLFILQNLFYDQHKNQNKQAQQQHLSSLFKSQKFFPYKRPIVF